MSSNTQEDSTKSKPNEKDVFWEIVNALHSWRVVTVEKVMHEKQELQGVSGRHPSFAMNLNLLENKHLFFFFNI